MRPMLAAALLLVGLFSDGPSVREHSLAEWRALLAPSASETAWRGIGWRASFWDAVQEANAADKPVLLWAMNGHPLGCT